MRRVLRSLPLAALCICTVAAIPWPKPAPVDQAVIATLPEAPPTAHCGRDELLCGDTCYDPTDADCDLEFNTITLFGPYISEKKKEAREKAREDAAKKEAHSSAPVESGSSHADTL
ncbi:hypothetical protein TWF696_000037 [Orbilia brochopaga]|uniref:Secreted protein n=1 Tax=Orbilia brochopaga TaxID=3140254 RepID=A0AAV9VA36_9PEZI